MPRLAGQIDRAKNEAILDATSDVVFERGLAAPLDEIARRAGVSKQTIYNHYGSKAELIRALIDRRRRSIDDQLEVAGAETHPEETLCAYARALLNTVLMDRGIALFRLLIATAPQSQDLVRKALPGGARGARVNLTAYLEREAGGGRLAIADAAEAADFFAGMVIGHHQVEGLLGMPTELDEARIERIASEAARRFVRAYAA